MAEKKKRSWRDSYKADQEGSSGGETEQKKKRSWRDSYESDQRTGAASYTWRDELAERKRISDAHGNAIKVTRARNRSTKNESTTVALGGAYSRLLREEQDAIRNAETITQKRANTITRADGDLSIGNLRSRIDEIDRDLLDPLSGSNASLPRYVLQQESDYLKGVRQNILDSAKAEWDKAEADRAEDQDSSRYAANTEKARQAKQNWQYLYANLVGGDLDQAEKEYREADLAASQYTGANRDYWNALRRVADEKKLAYETLRDYQGAARVESLKEEMDAASVAYNEAMFDATEADMRGEDPEAYRGNIDQAKKRFDAARDLYEKTYDEVYGQGTVANALELGGTAIMRGVATILKQATSTLNFINQKDIFMSDLNKEFSSDLNNAATDWLNSLDDRTTITARRMGDSSLWGYGADAVTTLVDTIPFMAMAVATAGSSAGGSVIAEGGSKFANLMHTIGNVVTNWAKDPSFWTGVAMETGMNYEQAKGAGANEYQATAYAMVTSLVNAAVEVGINSDSGIQGVPKMIVEAADSGNDAFVRAIIKSAISEGNEEMLQDIVSGINAFFVYGHDTGMEWFSTTNEDAAINPKRIAESGLMGAVVAVPGGAITAAGTNIRNRNVSRQISANGAMDQLIDMGLQQEPDTRAYQLAYQAKGNQQLNEEISDTLTGELYSELEPQLKEQYDAAVEEQEKRNEARQQMIEERGFVTRETAYDDIQQQLATITEIETELAETGVSKEHAKTLAELFQNAGSREATSYAAAVSQAYQMGRTKTPVTELPSVGYAPGMVLDRAYALGRERANADYRQSFPTILRKNPNVKGTVYVPDGMEATFNQRQQVSTQALRRLAEATGVNIHLFSDAEDSTRNGYYDSDGIHINIDAGMDGQSTMLFTAAHEYTHFIKDQAADKFRVLADFLMDKYGEADVSVEYLIDKQMQLAERHGIKGFDRDQAYEEVVADAMEKMFADGNVIERLEELKAKDRTLWENLRDFVRDLAKKIREVYKDIKPNTLEAQFVDQMGSAIEQLQELFTEGLVAASENYQASRSLNTEGEGAAFSKAGDPVAYSTPEGSVLLSIKTYEDEGRAVLRNYLQKQVSKGKLTAREMQEMIADIEDIYEVCKAFKNHYAPFSSWSDAKVVTDTHGRPVFSVVTPNNEYKMNIDFSLVCKKRRALDAVLDEMARRGVIDDFELGQKSTVLINAMIRKNDLETACALCFVDARRYRQAAVADSFVNLYNELVESLVPENQIENIGHFNFSGNISIQDAQDTIDAWDNSRLDFSHIDNVIRTYGKNTVEHKAALYIKRSKEARKLLQRGDFMSSSAFDAVKSTNKQILSLYNSKKGTGGPKAAFGDVQYLNDIIKNVTRSRSWTPAKAYSVGGVRIQSFSDYVPRMVFDYVQMIYDLAATGLPAHAYTKEAAFARQFGLTGVKINMSLIPAITKDGIAPGLDASGNYVWAGESFNFEEAKAIQNAYGYSSNCGTICVGVSDEHINKLLADPDIRMVIPYHKSGLNPIVAHMNKIEGFTNYTYYQVTRDSQGKKVSKEFNFNEEMRRVGDPKKAAQNYLAWCRENGYTEKFPQFSGDANYYKLLIDFTVYDDAGQYAAQHEVQAVFPKDSDAFGSMKSLIQNSLEEDAVIEGRKQLAVGKIVDEIVRTLPRTEAEIEDVEVEQATGDVEKLPAKNSLRRDSSDRELTSAQSAYFANSKARDAQGRLMVLYHGSSKLNFTVFNPKYSDDGISMFLTDDPVVAQSYAGETERVKNPYKLSYRFTGQGILPVYANLENPLVVDAGGKNWALIPAPDEMAEDVEFWQKYNDDLYEKGALISRTVPQKGMTVNTRMMSAYAKYKGYDGVIFQNLVDLGGFGDPHERVSRASTIAVVFDADQVKSVENKTPTHNPDIRYSLRDNGASARSLLADALLTVAQDEDETRALTEYKEGLAEIDALEAKKAELVTQYREEFAKSGTARNPQLIESLVGEIQDLNKQIHNFDRTLINLEATEPIKKFVARERQKGYKSGAKHVRDIMERNLENRKRTMLRGKILRTAKKLSDMLVSKTRDKHVPYMLEQPVAQLLSAFDVNDIEYSRQKLTNTVVQALVTPDPKERADLTKRAENLKAVIDSVKSLQSAYDNLAGNKDKNEPAHDAYDDVVAQYIRSIANELEEKYKNDSLHELNSEQLEELYKTYAAVLGCVRNVNKVFAQGQKKRLSDLRLDAVDEISTMHGGDREEFTEFVGKGVALRTQWNNLIPIYAMRRIGSDTLTRLWNNVAIKGQGTYGKDVAETQAFFADLRKRYDFDSWNMDETYGESFTSANGKTFWLTLGEMMSIYAYSRRDNAKQHLLVGGFTHDSSIRLRHGGRSYKPNASATYKMTNEIIEDIVSKLTEEQRGFVTEMQGYLSDTMGAKGNDVSRALYQVELFGEENYFPMKVTSSGRPASYDGNDAIMQLKNMGFTKPLDPNATSALVVGNFMRVWDRHVNQMSAYHAYVLPMEDFSRVVGGVEYVNDGDRVSVITALDSAFQDRVASSYLNTLIQDINGKAGTDSRGNEYGRFVSLSKKAAVALSASVAIQQPSSIERVKAYLDDKYFLGAPRVKISSQWDEIKNYAPIAVIKDLGRFDVNMGQTLGEYIHGKTSLDDITGWLPGYMDRRTWVNIWYAIKRETMAERKDLQPGSEAFLQHCGERFTEMVQLTQVVDSVFTRSQLMRSKNQAAQVLTSFMAEPTLTQNMLMDAHLQARRGEKKQAARTTASVLRSLVLNAILVSFVHAARDDDEDQSYVEKYVEAFLGNMENSLMPWNYFPFLRDLGTVFVNGYDIGRADMTLLSSLAESLRRLYGVVTNDVKGDAGMATVDVVLDIANIFGVPARNVWREFMAARNVVTKYIPDAARGIANGSDAAIYDTTITGLRKAVHDATNPLLGKELTKIDQIYHAKMTGDDQHLARLKRTYGDEQKFNDALRKALQANDRRIIDAAEAHLEGDLATYERIKEEIVADGKFDRNRVVAAIKSVESSLTPDEEKEYTDTRKQAYGADDIIDAYLTEPDMIDTIKADMTETYVENGRTEEDAERLITSAINTAAKEQFEQGLLTEQQAIALLVDQTGKTKDDAYWTVEKWQTGESSTYGTLRKALWSGENLSAAVRELTSHGYDAEKVQSEVRSSLQQMYWGEWDGSKTSLSKNLVIKRLVSHGGKTQEEAEKLVREWTCYKITGIKYGNIKQAYLDRKITASRAVKMLQDYGGLTEKEAQKRVESYN